MKEIIPIKWAKLNLYRKQERKKKKRVVLKERMARSEKEKRIQVDQMKAPLNGHYPKLNN